MEENNHNLYSETYLGNNLYKLTASDTDRTVIIWCTRETVNVVHELAHKQILEDLYGRK